MVLEQAACLALMNPLKSGEMDVARASRSPGRLAADLDTAPTTDSRVLKNMSESRRLEYALLIRANSKDKHALRGCLYELVAPEGGQNQGFVTVPGQCYSFTNCSMAGSSASTDRASVALHGGAVPAV
jgi:hypothetical protein